MKQCLLSTLIIFSVFQLHAWDIFETAGSRSNSLGKCSVSLSDFWSCINNPAGISSLKDISLGFSYENRFLMKELAYKNLGVVLPTDKGVFSLSVSQFGFTHYNENVFALIYAKNFGPNLRIGLKLDYVLVRFSEDYDNLSIPTFEIGMQYKIKSAVCIGAHLINPINIKLKTINKDKLPVIMRLGISYNILDNLLLTSEIEENFEYNFSYKSGIEYEIVDNIFIRCGIHFNPQEFSFGFGYNNKFFVLDIAAQINQILGTSINCSLVYNIKRNQKPRL